MLIPARHNVCIWCGRPFLIEGMRRHASEVIRSQEHIIPDCLWGHLLTEDVCVGCNNTLGRFVDKHLQNDGGVFTAGRAAGFKAEELLPCFRVRGTGPNGEPFLYTVKQGMWRLEPSFTATGFKIGSINGRATPQDLANAKRKMIKLIMADASHELNQQEVEHWVNDLFAEFATKQGQQTVYRKQIKQGLRTRPVGGSQGAVTITTHPWQTQWCIAKILYEAASVLLPERLRKVVWSAMAQLKQFVDAREERRGVFKHRKLAASPRPVHEVEIVLDGSELRMLTRLFGTEQWSIRFGVTKNGRPARLPRYSLLIVDRCRAGGGTAATVNENGRELFPV